MSAFTPPPSVFPEQMFKSHFCRLRIRFLRYRYSNSFRNRRKTITPITSASISQPVIPQTYHTKGTKALLAPSSAKATDGHSRPCGALVVERVIADRMEEGLLFPDPFKYNTTPIIYREA